MEQRFIKYIYILIIFFFGLSLGSIDIPNDNDKIQDEVDEVEGEIEEEGNDYDGPDRESIYIKHNFFTILAKSIETFFKNLLIIVIGGLRNIIDYLFI